VLDPVAEFNPLDDFGQAVLPIEFASIFLGREHQLVRHGQRGLSAEASLGFDGSVPDRGESALDRVRGADMFPVLGREVVKRQQVGAVLGQALHRPVILRAVGFGEEIEGSVGGSLGFGHPYVFQVRLGFRLHRFRHGVQNIRRLVDPAALNAGLAVNLMQRRPEPHGPIPNRQLGWCLGNPPRK